MERNVTFTDVQALLLPGRYAANSSDTAFDVENEQGRFIYREEWDQETTEKLRSRLGFPVMVSELLRNATGTWHRFTYKTRDTPHLFVTFTLVWMKNNPWFSLHITVFKKYSSSVEQLDYSDLTDREQKEWSEIVEHAETCLLEKTEYRLFHVTGELNERYQGVKRDETSDCK